MAGIQQAVNAITGSIGTVGARVNIYSELVGENKKLREKALAQNEELANAYTALQERQSSAEAELDAIHQKEWEKMIDRQEKRERKKEHEKRIERRASIIDREWERNASHMSKNMMTAALFGDLSSGSGGGI